MPKSDNFRTYIGNYLNGLGLATVIVTVDTAATPFAYSEYFAFLENDELIYDELRISCDRSNVPSGIADLDLSTLADDAVSQAEQRLSRKLRERYKSFLPENPISKLIDLSINHEPAIIRLIMRNKFSDKIDRVIKITKSEKLRSFLTEHKDLPKLVYEENLK